MKKKILIAMSVLLMNVCAAVGCSGTEPEQQTETQQTAAESTNTAPSTEQSELCGTLDELKDFMFIVTDDEQISYAFTYEEMPEGLDSVTVGDRVKVIYTGVLSEIDAFTGEVLSVEKQ